MALDSIYLLLLFFQLIIIMSVTIYLISMIYSSLHGAPYVPSKDKDIYDTLAQANLKRGQIFIELGSGDGRVVSAAVQKYHVRGIGIEISPLLVFYSRLLAKMRKINYISFKRGNVYSADISKADVIYLFLMPKMLIRLSEKIKKEAKKKVLIISHGFKIPGFEKFLIRKVTRKIFSSYLYRI